MKNAILATLTLRLILAAGVAQADYICKSDDGTSSLAVREHHITRLGNASITITSKNEDIQYFGTIKSDPDSDGATLFMRKVIELYPNHGDRLTIVASPRACGRGSCRVIGDPIISADLKIGDANTYFLCHEPNR